MPSAAGNKISRRGHSSRSYRRQTCAFEFWFAAVSATFVCVVATFTNAQTISVSPAPALGKIIPGPITVKQDPVACALSLSTEPGMIAITIVNTSTQVIDKRRAIYFQTVPGQNAQLYGVRAPTVTPIAGQFSSLIPQQSGLQPGPCLAWIYAPRQALQTSQ